MPSAAFAMRVSRSGQSAEAASLAVRCFNRLKQWRRTAMRTAQLARSYRAAVCLAATLIWITTDNSQPN